MTSNFSKSGHQVIKQTCFSQYDKSDNKEHNGYEYFISWQSHILYIYECGELVFSRELREDKSTHDNWAKYFINDLINKAKSIQTLS